MSDYTPTTEEVREDWAWDTHRDQDIGRARFDRWHAQVRADTLRHAAQHIPNAYQHGDSPSAWLNRRADQEEGRA